MQLLLQKAAAAEGVGGTAFSYRHLAEIAAAVTEADIAPAIATAVGSNATEGNSLNTR